MTLRSFLILFGTIALISCGGRFNGYNELDEDVHVKLVAFDDTDSRSMQDSAHFVRFIFSWNFLGDKSTIAGIDRTYKNLNADAIANAVFWADLAKRQEGDSLHYLLSCDVWKASILSSEFDFECDEGSEMIELDLLIKEIKSKTEFASAAEALNFSEPAEEVSFLEQYLQGEQNIERVGDLFLERYSHRPKAKKIERDSLLRLHYAGYLLDGRMFDHSPADSGLVFRKGEQGQVLKGIELAIAQCAYGDSVGVYLPPYLAFGARGSGNGVIAPFTPVFYALKVDSLK